MGGGGGGVDRVKLAKCDTGYSLIIILLYIERK